MLVFQSHCFLSDSCEELCALSALRHRSMAKRTIAVAETATKGKSSDRNASHVIPLGLAAEQEARLAKRREIMERADRRRVSLARDIPSPLSMLSEARDERDDAFGRTIEGIRPAIVVAPMPSHRARRQAARRGSMSLMTSKRLKMTSEQEPR